MIPAIAYEALPGQLASALAPRVQRLGYLGEFFQRTAHQPDALLAFDQFSQRCASALGADLTLVVALTVSTASGSAYERNQHERRAVRRGHSRTWVAAVEELRCSDRLSVNQRAAQQLTVSLIHDHGLGSTAELDRYALRFGPEAAIALLMTVGRFVAHGTIANSLDLRPPVPSIFEDGFDG